MGRAVIAAVALDPRVVLAGAVEHAGHACVGTPLAPGLVVCSNPRALAHAAQVLVDFTTPAALADNLEAACAARTPIVIGTTGLDAGGHAAIDAAARSVAVLQSANMSVGVAVLVALVEAAAARLPWAVEVLELHHAAKADLPSGTALALGDAVTRARAARAGPARRPPRIAARTGPAEIGYAALRGGTSAGEHSVFLLGDGERLELTHRAETREVFAKGALAAALWLRGRPPGRYAMADLARD